MEKEYTLGLYEKAMPERLSWKEKLEAAKAAGFDFVEVSIDETDEKLSRLDMSQAERLEMLNLMRIVGIPIRTMCLSGHRKYPLGSHEEEAVMKDLYCGKGHLVAMHLKETKPGIFREVEFGKGHVDFQTAIETAWELGIRKFVTEFWYMGNQNWERDLLEARQMMSDILDKQRGVKQEAV